MFEQAIVNGEIDLETVLASGLMGGGIEIGKDLVTALINNEAFDFGGLLSEDSSLYETLNGVDGKGGLINDIRGNFKEFVDKYVPGGEFWEGVGERYESVTEEPLLLENGQPNPKAGQFAAVDYTGNVTYYDSIEDLVNAGFVEISSSNPFLKGIMDTLGYVPDEWIQGVSDLINNSGGSYTTEGGSVITTETPDDDEEDDDDDFDCSTVSRVQIKGAKTAADCGACLEGFSTTLAT